MDGLRFAFGTLTVFPARITRWDRDAARAGMLCAPLAGLVVGVCAAGLGGTFLALDSGPLLAAVATTAVPAVLTRGLHLDGLADTADGLGSAKPAEDALRIMKQSDVGPFGVIVLLLVLLAQVAALYELYGESWAHGAAGAALAATVARLALTHASRHGVLMPAPRASGRSSPRPSRSARRPSRRRRSWSSSPRRACCSPRTTRSTTCWRRARPSARRRRCSGGACGGSAG